MSDERSRRFPLLCISPLASPNYAILQSLMTAMEMGNRSTVTPPLSLAIFPLPTGAAAAAEIYRGRIKAPLRPRPPRRCIRIEAATGEKVQFRWHHQGPFLVPGHERRSNSSAINGMTVAKTP